MISVLSSANKTPVQWSSWGNILCVLYPGQRRVVSNKGKWRRYPCIDYLSSWCMSVPDQSNFWKEGFVLVHGLNRDTVYHGKEGVLARTLGSWQCFILNQEVGRGMTEGYKRLRLIPSDQPPPVESHFLKFSHGIHEHQHRMETKCSHTLTFKPQWLVECENSEFIWVKAEDHLGKQIIAIQKCYNGFWKVWFYR